ncbi:dihydrodipicolinate synthase family protein [Mycolicibacterium brisbanense]|uniref:Dihydrodipicolinate synthase n=1 Tax=Mycolicibacterium brisbanense TaxID=146020 RepID=A0A100VTP5_9MYCO|nr:dihydrodipicolinate synthase family protein [Mycolicibacterium brisbanense]MCV7160470.1 dihydrodipicolinate synthase family protein [Mycolicibacterium brisbanense]GAS85932.1 dihydrodipicolinate synthase [Mycolicibacterium brisbanense]
MTTQPWHGIVVATALPFNADLSVDYDAYAEHVKWLAENGCHGVTPNGSLGEYQCLSREERAKVVAVAVEAAPDGFSVVPGTGAYGSGEALNWARQAKDAGAHALLSLPPNAYRADDDIVVAHYEQVASAGLPVVAYNNPYDTKVDLSPALLARLHAEGLIVAVKEFSGDVRRIYELQELAPDLDVLVGTDDVVLELAIAGAKGWIAGYPNALPVASAQLWDFAVAQDLDQALPLYRDLHSLLRWDSKPAFVQAIKLSMDVAGRKGGACRPPRLPLSPEIAAKVRKDTEEALSRGYR